MLGSGTRSTAPGSAAVNDGQPVPLSNLAFESYSAAPQPAQLHRRSVSSSNFLIRTGCSEFKLTHNPVHLSCRPFMSLCQCSPRHLHSRQVHILARGRGGRVAGHLGCGRADGHKAPALHTWDDVCLCPD